MRSIPVPLLALIGVCAVAMPACASEAQLMGDAVSSFSAALASAQKVVSDNVRALDEIQKRRIIEPMFFDVRKLCDPNDKNCNVGEAIADTSMPAQNADHLDALRSQFAEITCTASQSLLSLRKPLNTLGAYSSTLKALNKEPKQDISSIVASIQENWSRRESLKPTEMNTAKGDVLTSQCQREVINLVSMTAGQAQEFAFVDDALALGAAITAMREAAKKVVVPIFSFGEQRLRAKRLREYILDSKGTVVTAFDGMEKEDPKMQSLCDAWGNAAPCRTQIDGSGVTSAVRQTHLDGAFVTRKWAALRKPWFLWLSMHAARESFRANFKVGDGPFGYWYLQDRQFDEFKASLSEYGTLRTTESPAAILVALKAAHAELVRSAENKGALTPQSLLAVMKDINSRVGESEDALRELRDALGDVRTKGRSVLSAIE